MLFKQTALDAIQSEPAYSGVKALYDSAFERRKAATAQLAAATHAGGDAARLRAKAEYRRTQDGFQAARGEPSAAGL
jgi:hypothetical protein